MKIKTEKLFYTLIFLLTSLVFSSELYADKSSEDASLQYKYSSIELNLQKEQWLKTSVPLVTIKANVTLSQNENLIQTRENLLQKLNALNSDTSWDITVFDSSQSDSGLEEIRLQAQARVSEKNLNTLRQKIKNVTQPGLKMQVLSIDFTPSLAESEKVLADLRSAIYKETLLEIDRLNTLYGQKFKVKNITFNPVSPFPAMMAMNAMSMRSNNADQIKAKIDADTSSPTMLAVSSKVELNAKVQLVSETKD